MNESDLQKLLKVQQSLKQMIENNLEIVSYLEKQVKALEHQYNLISEIITSSSFVTADELLDTESFVKKFGSKKITHSDFEKKIFDAHHNLVATLIFRDSVVNIRFVDPMKCKITEENYIEFFLRPYLVPLKKSFPSLEVQLSRIQDNSGRSAKFLSQIIIKNLNSIEAFDLLEKHVREFLEKIGIL